jgi:hypothetical protein
MKSTDTLASPPLPNFIVAIRAGFDAIANHVPLILFPVGLDLLLWFGPRLRLTGLINGAARQLMNGYQNQDPRIGELLRSAQDLWTAFADQFNMFMALRTYPVGIPSLMASRMPITAPVGHPSSLELDSVMGVLGAWIILSLVGLVIGTLYFALVAQVALAGGVSWRQAFELWPRATLQLVYLALLLTGVILLASIPGGFLISLVALGGLSLGQCALLIYTGFILWLILPLVFSPHGIIVNQSNLLTAIKLSANLIRKTLPTSVLFLLAIFLLSKGLDILWLIPNETSWLLIVGILGHGFVTTSLLASSFVYYRDSMRWMVPLGQPGRASMI